MQKSSFDKWLVTLALVAVIAGAIFHFVKSDRGAQGQNQKPGGAGQPGVSESYDFHPSYVPSVPRPTASQPGPAATSPSEISREKIEAWLAKHNRNAMSLLAAFRASGDTNYLNEAATNFPNNPQVELAVLARDEFPADRRKWLDLLKASSPGNSMANYLSAEDYFKNGNKDAAVQELLAATGKSQFNAYTTENLLDSEDLYSSSGDSAIETATAAMADMSKENLPELATFKRLAVGMGNLQKQYLDSGDTASVVNLAQMGMTLGNQLESGDSGKYLINQLVGIADEAIVLSQLDQNTSYDFLGGQTPAQVLQQNQAWKASVSELSKNFQAAYLQMNEAEKLDYIKRTKENGEVAAMRWLVQQHPPSNP